MLSAAAQQTLYVKHAGEFRRVVDVVDKEPQCIVDGKVVAVESGPQGYTFAMGKADTYSPFYVEISYINVKIRGTSVGGSDHLIDKTFEFAANLTSPYRLQHAFIVLALTSKGAGDGLLVTDIGAMKPGKSVPVAMRRVVSADYGESYYQLHVFVGGEEILHSEMAAETRETIMADLVAREVKGVTDAMPRKLVGPNPILPRGKGKESTGTVTLAFRVREDGKVENPVVHSSTNPLLNDAALAAIKYWRFVPRIKQGVPVASKLGVPFVFEADGED